jgi:phosphoserine phosphatase
VPNIAIVWDFDGTLTAQDSTSITAETLGGGTSKEFWDTVHLLKGDGEKKREWQHILASDAPVWMYALSRIAFDKKIPLNAQFLGRFVKPRIQLYPNGASFLRKLKLLEEKDPLKSTGTKIHYFIVSAGLKDLVEQILPGDLITWTFGSRYRVNAFQGNPDQPESIPVFCMDETMKTRSLFEISKGSFRDEKNSVNRRVEPEKRWAPFQNIIYIGDGDTDVPSLSLVRSQGGLGIAVYNPETSMQKVNEKLKCVFQTILGTDFRGSWAVISREAGQ